MKGREDSHDAMCTCARKRVGSGNAVSIRDIRVEALKSTIHLLIVESKGPF